MAARGFLLRFLIGPAEEDLAPAIIDHEGGKFGIVRCDNLADLAVRLRSAAGFVGNDSGVSHLAGVLGVPTVVIFGPADPCRWTPLGPRVRILRPAVDCTPCFETLPQNCDGERPSCLVDTHPEDVLAALKGLLGQGAWHW